LKQKFLDEPREVSVTWWYARKTEPVHYMRHERVLYFARRVLVNVSG
jgi:hypothetical protein